MNPSSELRLNTWKTQRRRMSCGGSIYKMIYGIITGRQVLSSFNTAKGIFFATFHDVRMRTRRKNWPMKTRIKIWTDDKLEGRVEKI